MFFKSHFATDFLGQFFFIFFFVSFFVSRQKKEKDIKNEYEPIHDFLGQFQTIFYKAIFGQYHSQ